MRLRIVIAIGLLLAFSLAASKAKAQEGPETGWGTPTAQSFGLRGRVQSVRTDKFRVIRKDGRKDGRLVEQRRSSKTDRFDLNGRLIESIDGDSQMKMTVTYDKQGRPAEMVMYVGPAPLLRTVSNYHAGKRAEESLTYIGGDKLMSREVLFKDEKGNAVRKEEERYLNMSGKPQQSKSVVTYTHTYDAQGREISSTIGNEKGAISYKFDSEYDAQGRRHKIANYQYDERSGTLYSKTVNTYDARGWVIVSETYDDRGELTRREKYSRVLDPRGNWIKETTQTFVNSEDEKGMFTTVTRRVITYY